MSSDILQRFMKDLIKSAKETEGFVKGSRMQVEIGATTKFAMDGSTMLSGIPGIGPGLGGLNAAARSGNMGHGFLTGAGAAVGQAAGGAAGSALGGLTDNDKLQLLMTILGSSGGGMLGGAAGRGIGNALQVEGGKTANHAGLGAALGSLIPIPGAGMAGAAIGADEGRGWPAAGGALLGGLGGALGGAALGHGMGGPELMKTLGYLGSIGGAAAGAHHYGKDDRNVVQRTVDKLSSARDAGAVAAAERFGIKEALFPLLGMAGSLLGGTAARAGVGALARRAPGGLASKALPHMTGGIGGAATDMVGGMAGGALGNRLQGNPQG